MSGAWDDGGGGRGAVLDAQRELKMNHGHDRRVAAEEGSRETRTDYGPEENRASKKRWGWTCRPVQLRAGQV